MRIFLHTIGWLLPFFSLVCIPVATARMLTAKDVLNLTYAASLKSQILRTQNQLASETVRESKSPYDTQLTGTFLYTDDKTTRASPIFGTETTSTTGSLGLAQLLPSGTRFGLEFLSDRESNDSAFFTSSKYFNQQTSFSITQPLARNFFGLIQRSTVQAAKQQQQTTASQVASGLQDLAYQNLKIFWNWRFALGVVAIEEEALALARKLYQTNRQKALLGLAEDFELYAYAANINIKQNELLIAQADTVLSADELASALNIAGQPIAVGPDSLAPAPLSSLNTIISQALQDNPDAQVLRSELKTLRIEIVSKKNAQLPQVDVSATLALNGLDPDYATALGNVGDVNPLLQTGLSVSFPLQNRQAKAQLKKTEILRVQKVLSLQDLESSIHSLVKAHYTRTRLGAHRLTVTAKAVENQRLKWGEEIKKYDQGRSDTDLVLRYQDDYLTARIMHLKAQIDYQLVLLDLNRWRGALKPSAGETSP